MIKISHNTFDWYFALFLLIINLVSKIIFINTQDISLDEPFTVYHAQFELITIIKQLSNYNNPPLFELLMHYWIKVFGISPLSVRLPPYIFACLSPVVLYCFTKRNFNRSVAICVSLMLSGSSLLVFYSHDCRVYSLFLLLSILSMHLFLELCRAHIKTLNMIFFILINTLLIYAHYFGAFVLLLQCTYLLISQRKKIREFLIYYLVTAFFYLPHFYVLFSRMHGSVSKGTWLQPPEGIESLYNMLWTFSNEPLVTVACIIVLLVGLFQLIIKKTHTRPNNNYLLTIIWFLVPFLGMFFISYKIPMYIGRYLIFVLPAYYLLLAGCIDAVIQKKLLKNIVLSLLVLSFLGSVNLNPDKKKQIKSVVGFIKSVKDDQTLVIVTPFDFLPTFAYHFDRKAFTDIVEQKEYKSTEGLLKKEGVFFVNNVNELKVLTLKKYKKIICLAVGNKQLSPQIVKTLQTRQTQVASIKFNDSYWVYVFKH